MPHSAIVSGYLKVLHFYDRPDIPMLFDLSSDMGEVTNIAARHSDQHQQLYTEMMTYFEKVGARLPKLNPDADLTAYEQDKDYRKRKDWGAYTGSRPLEEDER